VERRGRGRRWFAGRSSVGIAARARGGGSGPGVTGGSPVTAQRSRGPHGSSWGQPLRGLT